MRSRTRTTMGASKLCTTWSKRAPQTYWKRFDGSAAYDRMAPGPLYGSVRIPWRCVDSKFLAHLRRHDLQVGARGDNGRDALPQVERESPAAVLHRGSGRSRYSPPD